MLKEAAEEVGPAIGHVRGRGLMWGVELVKDDEQPDGELAARVITHALRCGVIVLAGGPAGNVLSLSPPLVITREQLEFGVDALAESLA